VRPGSRGRVRACARHTGGAIGGEANEAAADAVGQGVHEIGEAVSHVHVVHNRGAERVHGAIEEAQRYGHIVFCCSERKGFEKNNGHRNNAEERANRCVSEVVGIQAINHDLEDVAARVNHLPDMVPVVAVPLYQGAEGYRGAIVAPIHAVVSRVRRGSVRLGVRLQRCVVGAALDNCLQG